MNSEIRARIFEYLLNRPRAASLAAIKYDLGLDEPNLVERAVLDGLNSGQLILTSEGFALA